MSLADVMTMRATSFGFKGQTFPGICVLTDLEIPQRQFFEAQDLT